MSYVEIVMSEPQEQSITRSEFTAEQETNPNSRLEELTSQIFAEGAKWLPDLTPDQVSRFLKFSEEIAEQIYKGESLADYDELTGLLNLRGTRKALLKAIGTYQRNTFRPNSSEYTQASQHAIAILLIDGDKIKDINDSIGHEEGDNAIIAIAETIKRSASRPTDSLGRTGGDEFSVILPETNLFGALIVAEKIRNGVVSVAENDQRFKSLSVSIGIALYSNGISVTQLINNADKAMYRAKESRNAISIHPGNLPTQPEEIDNLTKFIKDQNIACAMGHIETTIAPHQQVASFHST